MKLYVTFYLFCVAIAAANLLLTAILLFTLRRARNLLANRVLGIVLLLLGASFMTDLLRVNHIFDYYPHLYEYDTPMGLCIGPLFYCYIRYQINPKNRLQPLDLLHLLPVVLYMWLLHDFLFNSASAKLEMITNHTICLLYTSDAADE